MRKKKKRKHFMWVSKSISQYRNWESKSKEDGDCTVLLEKKDDNKWRKVDCNQRHMFWCDDRNIPKPGTGFKAKEGKASVQYTHSFFFFFSYTHTTYKKKTCKRWTKTTTLD